MVKSRVLLFGTFIMICFLSGCTSRLLVTTNGCQSKGKWNTIEREFNTSLGDKLATKIDHQKKYFDHVFVERIWTPLGQFSREKLKLKELLRINGIKCSNIKSIEITYYNDYVDILTSAIPFLSSRSIMLKVRTF